MPDRITTGPFRVPSDWVAGQGLVVTLLNPTNQARTVRVVVDEVIFDGDPPACPNTQVAVMTPICQVDVTVPALRAVQTQATGFTADDVLRVTVSGATDDEGGLVEVSVVGDRNGAAEPTMFFRHGDFVEVEDD